METYPIYRTTRHGGIDGMVGEVTAECPDAALAAYAASVGVEGATIREEGVRVILDNDGQFIHYTYADADPDDDANPLDLTVEDGA